MMLRALTLTEALERAVIVLISLALVLDASLAAAQDRRLPGGGGGKQVALVIGNDHYPAMPLKNAVSDARAMAAVLKEVGFNVDLVVDADQPAMEKAINAFVGRLVPGDVALLFFSGHGIQVEGFNYLVPVSFDATNEVDAKYQAYNADRLHEKLAAAGTRLNILILDACRNNPFRAVKSASGGLAAMQTGKGSFIAFATAPGKTASDNPAGRNGLFTQHLVAAIAEQGLGLNDVFDRVRERVVEASGGQQVPWTSSSVIGSYQFRPAAVTGSPAAVPPVPPGESVEVAFWNSIGSSQDPNDFEAYLRRYPQGEFADLARNRLEQLKTARPIPATQAPGPKAGGQVKAGSLMRLDAPGLIAPVVAHRVDPAYPEAARLNRRQGVVSLMALVNEDGSVVDVGVVSGAGEDLDAAAVAALKQWSYTPATYGGVPVKVWLPVSVSFKL